MLAMLATYAELRALTLIGSSKLPNVVSVVRGRRDSDIASRRLAIRRLPRGSLHRYTILH